MTAPVPTPVPRVGTALIHPDSPDAKAMYEQIKRGADSFLSAFDVEGVPPAMRAWSTSQIEVVLRNFRRWLAPNLKESADEHAARR